MTTIASEIREVKLLHRSEGGSLVRSSATIAYVGGRIEFLKSPYALKNEIRAMQGSKWHGYSDPPRKIWSVTDCQRNRFQLAYLMGEDVYGWFDQEVKKHEYTRPLMPHQKDLADHFLTYHYGLMAAEMGCVAEETLVEVRFDMRRDTLTLDEFYLEWRLNQRQTRQKRKLIYIKGLKGFAVRLLRVFDVVRQGCKPVVQVTLKSGRRLRVTHDHELFTAFGQSKRADLLLPGDTVLSGTGIVEDDTVVAVIPAGDVMVYDVRCEHPHHNFLANGVVVANCGKTLSAQEVMERSGIKDCWWIGPKTSLPNIQREFRRWSLDPTIHVEMLNYEALKRVVDEWDVNTPVPQLVVFDESSRCKGATSQRSDAAQQLADMVRDKYGHDGYVILMSGTPSPKSPLDWFKQCEIAWPGFLKEGSSKAMEERLAFLVNHEYDAGVFKKRIGWKDDERKCKHCGLYEESHTGEYHIYEPSINEVSYLHERLKGLVIIKHKKDCLDLPDKQYRRVMCKPNASTLRAAQALVAGAPNTITGLTLLRELSDGFQYRDVKDGTTRCPHCCGNKQVDEWFDAEGGVYQSIAMIDASKLQKRSADCPRCRGKGEVAKTVRVSKEFPCPKDAALRDLLDECEETGRIVVFAGFTGSVDRVVNLCRKEGWDVVRCDGRGWVVTKADGTTVSEEEPLDYWSNMDHARVAFVSHPESGGMSLTLTESRMAVYWSNSYKPEYRAQSEDRIHRIGMDLNKGCVIVDLIHLPSDERVLEVIRENRRIELMTLGEVLGDINWEAQL